MFEMVYRCFCEIPDTEEWLFAIRYDKQRKPMFVRRLIDWEAVQEMQIAYPDWIIEID